jgi:predicted RNA-binding Zn-ribbon protein involved in translation (DUF1610 family)
MKFYKVILEPISNNKVLEYAYKRFPNTERIITAIQNGDITLSERIGDGKCPNCGKSEWMILSIKNPAVKEGGKSYIECINCGHTTHL